MNWTADRQPEPLPSFLEGMAVGALLVWLPLGLLLWGLR